MIRNKTEKYEKKDKMCILWDVVCLDKNCNSGWCRFKKGYNLRIEVPVTVSNIGWNARIVSQGFRKFTKCCKRYRIQIGHLKNRLWVT